MSEEKKSKERKVTITDRILDMFYEVPKWHDIVAASVFLVMSIYAAYMTTMMVIVMIALQIWTQQDNESVRLAVYLLNGPLFYCMAALALWILIGFCQRIRAWYWHRKGVTVRGG